MALLLIALTPRSASPQSGAFRIEEATIADMHRAIQSGSHLQDIVQAYIARASAYNGVCTALVTKDGAPIAAATGIVRAGAADRLSDQDGCRSPRFCRTSTSTRDRRSNSAGWSRRSRTRACSSSSACASAFRMRASSTRWRRSTSAASARSPARATFDRASVDWPAAGGCAGSVRRVPQAARRARARGRARRAVRQQSRSREAADVLRRVLVEELVRREGHARHRRQRRQLRDGRADERFAGRRRSARRRARSSSASRPRPTARRRVCRGAAPGKAAIVLPDGNLAYGPWGGQPCNPYDTERVPRGTSSGSGVSVCRESRRLLDLRADGRLRARARHRATTS